MTSFIIFMRLVITIIVMAFFAGCENPQSNITGTEEADPVIKGAAQMQFIHSASSTSELDLAVRNLTDDKMYLIEKEVVYGHQYGYYNLYSGEREVKLFISASNIAVAETKITIEDQKKYTIIACDLEATINPNILLLEDTTATPDSGKAFVRFVHAGTDVPTIRISEKDSSLTIARLNRLQHSGYVEFSSRTYYFNVATESDDALLIVEPITFLSGHSYCIIFSGSISNMTHIDFNAGIYRETTL